MENLKRARVQDGPRAILRFLASLPPPTRHSFKLSPPPLPDVRLPVTEAKRLRRRRRSAAKRLRLRRSAAKRRRRGPSMSCEINS